VLGCSVRNRLTVMVWLLRESAKRSKVVTKQYKHVRPVESEGCAEQKPHAIVVVIPGSLSETKTSLQTKHEAS
jgi:hypothetical protein